MNDFDLYYAVADYYATGEGRTISILIGRPNYKDEHYIEKPSFENKDGTYSFKQGILKPNSRELVIRQNTSDRIGEYLAIGTEILSEEEFNKRFSKYIPEFLLEIKKEAYVNYFVQYYYNFS